METSLRVVLLVVGLFIVAGITWDWIQSRRFRKRIHKTLKPYSKTESDRDPLDEDVILLTPSKAAESESSSSIAPENDLVILHVMARQPGVFSGKKLMEAFKEASLIYGDWQVFHRFENNDGTGQCLFSVSSAVEPGVFDMAKMDSFVSPGLSLFFNITGPNQAITAFESMLRTAKQLAQRLDGELRDENRRIMTNVGIERYRDQVRSFGKALAEKAKA